MRQYKCLIRVLPLHIMFITEEKDYIDELSFNNNNNNNNNHGRNEYFLVFH